METKDNVGNENSGLMFNISKITENETTEIDDGGKAIAERLVKLTLSMIGDRRLAELKAARTDSDLLAKLLAEYNL